MECGIDIITDGEMSKTSFLDYVKDRLAGFEVDPSPSRGMAPNVAGRVRHVPRLLRRLPQEVLPHGRPAAAWIPSAPSATPVTTTLETDIDNLKAAVAGKEVAEVFLPATSPSSASAQRALPDRRLPGGGGRSVREEYLAIVDAGFLLQIDDPWLIDTLGDPTPPRSSHGPSRGSIDTLNHALRGIPPDKIRQHTCYGLNHGPRLTDVDLRYVARSCCASTPAPTHSSSGRRRGCAA